MYRRLANPSPLFCTLAVLIAMSLWAGVPSALASQNDMLKQTFSFEPPMLKTMQHDDVSYTSIATPGALTMAMQAGEPSLPVRFVQILLPPGSEVANVKVTGSINAFDTDSHNLKAQPIFPHQRSVPIGMAPPQKLELNQGIYSSYAPFPAKDYCNVQVGYCRGYAILSLGLNPVKYVPATGKLSYFSEMTVNVELKNTGEINPFLRPDNAEDRAWVRKLVSNPELARDYRNMAPGKEEYPGGLCDPADNYDYVIITTTQNGLDDWNTSGTLPYNWNSMINKHAAVSGLTGTVVTVQEITPVPEYQNSNPTFNDTQARIREFCKDAYQDWGTQYILIGADAEWINARQLYYAYEGNVDSDIYWNHLDLTFNADGDSQWGEEGDAGFDLYAEMFIGRITADIPQDVSNWLKKCFTYIDAIDPEYIDNAAFYGGDTTWNCQGDDFVDYSAIKGCDNWLGPDPSVDPYPSWLGFQYGFETWNSENPASAFDMDVKWTAEPPNPGGWTGGSTSAAINGLRNAINNDECTLISCIAHANEYMSADVYYTDWENNYHNTMPFFLHDYGCHCGDMDAADDGVLHSMLLHSDTELAFGCVFNTGYGWGNFDNTCSSSSIQQKSFWDYMFDLSNSTTCDNWQLGKAQAFSKDLMAPLVGTDPDGTYRGVVECCLLFGDPALLIRPPAEPAIFMSFPLGIPSGTYPPGPETPITVQIQDGQENYVVGSGKMFYRFDPNDAFTESTLVAIGNDRYEGVIPNTRPGDQPEFYFCAEGDGGTTITLPSGAPSETYGFDLCFIELIYEDNFETETGWTVSSVNLDTGEWERANPSPTECQPGDDHSDPGTMCYVTGATGSSGGDNDVDGGPTTLTSPVYDLSSGDAEISFYLWFYHTDYGTQQPLEIDITNDGVSWTRVENVTHSPAWNLKSFRVSDFVTPTSNVKIRFKASDQPNDDLVEACLDDLAIQRFITDATLWADAYSIPVSTGKSINLDIDAGAANANRKYMILGSLSGTSPGYSLPGGAVLPLNWDLFTDVIMGLLNTQVFQNFYNNLDASGQMTATMDTLGPLDSSFIGNTAHFAFVLNAPFDYVSNNIAVTFDP